MSGSSDLKSVLNHVCPQITSKWHEFGKAVGMNEELLVDLFNYDPEESLQRVLDYWIKSSDSKPTWRDVARIMETIDIHNCAESIMREHVTGGY